MHWITQSSWIHCEYEVIVLRFPGLSTTLDVILGLKWWTNLHKSGTGELGVYDRKVAAICVAVFAPIINRNAGEMTWKVLILSISGQISELDCRLGHQCRFAMTLFSFAASRDSPRANLVTLRPASDLDTMATLRERTFVCFSPFACIHRWLFACFPCWIWDCGWMGYIYKKKILRREVGVVQITWENVLSWAGC